MKRFKPVRKYPDDVIRQMENEKIMRWLKL